MTSNPDRSLWTEPAVTRVTRGAQGGFRGSLVFCGIALVAALFGALTGGPRSLPGREILLALLLYAGWGTLLGAVVGLLLPLAARYVAVAMLIGALGGFTLYSGVALIADGPTSYRPGFSLMVGVPMGALLAYAFWRDARRSKIPPAPGAIATQPRLLTVEPYDSRMFCECCGYPTLRVPIAQHALEFDFAQRACPLCEWEIPRLTEAGLPVPNGQSAEERNDGRSLAEARASFGRHLSMYDPSKLEPWMLGPPSAEVIRRKGTLRKAYDALLASPDSARWDSWSTVRACEDALAAQIAGDHDDGDASTSSGESDV
jgi:hypothetical protein